MLHMTGLRYTADTQASRGLGMKVMHGDLLQLALEGAFDVIVHGCNCQCVMGKGIALSIKEQFPEAHAADCATPKGDPAKLGTISFA